MRHLMPLLSIAALSVFARADNFYPNVGTPVASTYLTAIATDDVTATFVSQGGDSADTIRLLDETTGVYSGYMINSHTATIGQVFDFGAVNAGDVLSFQVINESLNDADGYYITSGGIPNPVMSSDAALSTDGVSHTYVSGNELGFEDIPNLPDHNYPGRVYTDNDFNDLVVSVGNVDTAQTPEPPSLALLGTGLLGAVGVMRRKMSTQA